MLVLLSVLSLLRIKCFVDVHKIIDSPKIIGSLTACICKLFVNKIICVSNVVLIRWRRYVRNVDEKGIVIHNRINAILVNTKKSESFIFFLFGRIKPDKGQCFLIELLAIIPKDKLKSGQVYINGRCCWQPRKSVRIITRKNS